MAHYTGYISVPHASYQQWRDATLGNGYNVDYAFGDGFPVNLELLSFFVYYVPLFLHLACDVKRE